LRGWLGLPPRSHHFKANAASLPVIGGETRTKGAALEGKAAHPPPGLSRVVNSNGQYSDFIMMYLLEDKYRGK